MARIRYLKPDFFKDEDIAELPHQLRLFYAGLWCQADRAGRLEDRPQRLKVEIFPYERFDVEKALSILAQPKKNSQKPFLVRYEVSGERFIQILQWSKHQKPHHTERDSEIPGYNNAQLTVKPTLETVRNGDGEGDGKGNGDGLYVDFEKSTLTLWNSFCDKHPSLSKVQSIPGTRKSHLKKRFEQATFRAFETVLASIEEQPFLLNGNPDSKDHKNWKVSFDWLICNDTNHVKVLEKKYKDKTSKWGL